MASERGATPEPRLNGDLGSKSLQVALGALFSTASTLSCHSGAAIQSAAEEVSDSATITLSNTAHDEQRDHHPAQIRKGK